MKKKLKTITLISLIICIVIIGLFFASSSFLSSPPPSTEVNLIVRPENSEVIMVRTPIIPKNESYVVAMAEQAEITKNDEKINITFIQTQNENQASLLFEFFKSSFLSQGFTGQNLTSPYITIELSFPERPTIIILQKEKNVIICQSNDLDLVLDAANAQIT